MTGTTKGRPTIETATDADEHNTLTPSSPKTVAKDKRDQTDRPVADTAQELPRNAKDAIRFEGTWTPDGERNDADDAQDIDDAPRSQTGD